MKKRNMLIALAIVTQIGVGAFVAQSVIAQGRGSAASTATSDQTGSGLVAGGRNPNTSAINPPPPKP